jgi:anaerobic ribonucleoside-triphosphate reductase activating protein
VRDPATLAIGGITPFSSTDWPGKLAAVLFLQGCPWRCGYCHNPHLQPAASEGGHDYASVLGWLDTRRGLLDAVVFSGGEPTVHAALVPAMREVADRGFSVGLHTGGAYPRRLDEALAHADWVGLDVKAPARDYAAVTGIAGSGAAASASLRRVAASGVDYEVRTTVHPDLVPDDALVRLADELASLGVRRWVLQPFRPTGCADEALVAASPCGASLGEPLLARLRERVPGVAVRA